MAGNDTPASRGGKFWDSIGQEAVKAATDAATAAVTAALKPINDEVQGLKQSLGNLPTPESITKTVTDAVAAQQTKQAQVSARQAFINEKLKGIPDAYHSHIGSDPAKFAEQEQALRNVFKSDLEKLGVKADNVGGNAAPNAGGDVAGTSGGGKPVTAAIDTSTLSGVELLRMGVQQTSATGTDAKAQAAGNATGTTAADAAK